MDSVMNKIQKLLNLAGNNPNEEEAKAALLKAQELMARYNVTMEGLHEEASIKHTLSETNIKPHKLVNGLANVIASSFACKVIIIVNKICFFGRVDNANAASSAFTFAFSVMTKGARNACRAYGIKPGTKGASYPYNSYCMGFISGVKADMDAQTVALAVVVPEDVNTAFDARFAMRSRYKSSGLKAGINDRVYAEGYKDGSNMMDRRSLNA